MSEVTLLSAVLLVWIDAYALFHHTWIDYGIRSECS